MAELKKEEEFAAVARNAKIAPVIRPLPPPKHQAERLDMHSGGVPLNYGGMVAHKGTVLDWAKAEHSFALPGRIAPGGGVGPIPPGPAPPPGPGPGPQPPPGPGPGQTTIPVKMPKLKLRPGVAIKPDSHDDVPGPALLKEQAPADVFILPVNGTHMLPQPVIPEDVQVYPVQVADGMNANGLRKCLIFAVLGFALSQWLE